jgi:hypothetical protein
MLAGNERHGNFGSNAATDRVPGTSPAAGLVAQPKAPKVAAVA